MVAAVHDGDLDRRNGKRLDRLKAPKTGTDDDYPWSALRWLPLYEMNSL